MGRDHRTGILLAASAAVLIALELGAVGLATPRVRSLVTGPRAVAVMRAGAAVARGVARQMVATLVPARRMACVPRCPRG
ncbi:MAG TPA: hypothetical protein VMS88_03635 [Terriglobales bacterium]|nr:hypothetical protein [Terriglobales bacterium]